MLDALLIRSLVQTVDRGSLALRKKARDLLVREQHELLDDAMGDVALRDTNVDDGTFLIENDFRFRPVEVDRPSSAATGAKNLVER